MKAYRRWPWLQERYECHGGRGLCSKCRSYAAYHGTLVDFERHSMTRDEVLDEWALLRSEGHTIPQAAPRLGMTTAALAKALERARKDGDLRARFDYRGVKGTG